MWNDTIYLEIKKKKNIMSFRYDDGYCSNTFESQKDIKSQEIWINYSEYINIEYFKKENKIIIKFNEKHIMYVLQILVILVSLSNPSKKVNINTYNPKIEILGDEIPIKWNKDSLNLKKIDDSIYINEEKIIKTLIDKMKKENEIIITGDDYDIWLKSIHIIYFDTPDFEDGELAILGKVTH